MEANKLAFVDRPPTDAEIEKFRLILSTYQDGTGMLMQKSGRTLPGWRDFERSVAVAFNGRALESKYIYDVLLPNPEILNSYYGVSCKMRGMLSYVDNHQRVPIELSNASGEFWDVLEPLGVNQQNYQYNASESGKAIMTCVEGWHDVVGVENGGIIETGKSLFLILLYQKRTGLYQLFQYSISMPEPSTVEWSVEGRRLFGKQNREVLIEWYGFSGGQLKYYPHVDSALWVSERFTLEPLPGNIGDVMINKAREYFPEKWAKIE